MVEQTAAREAPPELTRQTAPRSGFGYLWRRFRRNRLALIGGFVLILLYVGAIAAPAIATHEPNRITLGKRFSTPSAENLLGTDESGRDVFSRLVYGSRISLTVGLVATLLSIVVGTAVGAAAGFVGRFVDSLLMRAVDGMLTIPTFFLALLVLAVLGSSLRNVILVIGLTSWMVVARVVRSEIIRAKNEEYVTAAHAIGAPPMRVLIYHALPQAVPSLIVSATLGIGYAIVVESSLSFLGLGVRPPMASWGNMLSGAQNYIWNRPDLALYPGLLIFVAVMAFNMVGDALRDTLDPRQTLN